MCPDFLSCLIILLIIIRLSTKLSFILGCDTENTKQLKCECTGKSENSYQFAKTKQRCQLENSVCLFKCSFYSLGQEESINQYRRRHRQLPLSNVYVHNVKGTHKRDCKSKRFDSAGSLSHSPICVCGFLYQYGFLYRSSRG